MNFSYTNSTQYLSSILYSYQGGFISGFSPVLTSFHIESFSINTGFIINSLLPLWFLFVLLPLTYNKIVSTLFTMSSENEINSIDDLLVIFFIVVIFYASYILYFAGFFTTTTLELILTLSIAYVGCLPFILLSGMLLNFRYYNVIFINGAGNSNSFLYDFVMDIINVLAFNIRVIVQLVRILILYSTYYLLALLYDELSYNIFITSNYLTTQSFSGYLTTYVRLVFEIGHVLIIFFMQTAAFIFMLFWLFQFLFTCFSETPSELPNYNV